MEEEEVTMASVRDKRIGDTHLLRQGCAAATDLVAAYQHLYHCHAHMSKEEDEEGVTRRGILMMIPASLS